MENNKKDSIIFNTLLLNIIEEDNSDLALKVISNPNLDGKELSQLIYASLRGTIVNKTTGETVKISNKLLMAAMLNKINQI